MVYVLNTLIPWRTVALVGLSVPILTVIGLCFVPETPLWLLSKNRFTEAEKALCWLRGWAPKQAIHPEFHALQRYSQRSKSCITCYKQNQPCSHPLPTLFEKLPHLLRTETLKPLFLVTTMFIIAEFTGTTGMSSFIVQIFAAYESPIAPDRAAAILSIVNNAANIVFLCLIRFTGKRHLYLTMLSIVFICSATISGYGFAVLPTGYNSFDHNQSQPLQHKQLAYIPFVCIFLWNFSSFCGVNSVPWQFLSEVYPFKLVSIFFFFVRNFSTFY